MPGTPPPEMPALLMVTAILTCAISVPGGLIQVVMSTVGFADGRTVYGALILVAAVATLLFGIGGSVLTLLRGSQLGRVLVTLCCLFYLGNGTITLALGNIGSISQLVVAIPLAVLWWIPPTSRGLRDRKTAVAHRPR